MAEIVEDLVWYCSYGSNLDEERFERYILGGAVPGSKRVERGCRTDKTLPRRSKLFTVRHPLCFAWKSQLWSGSVAFLEWDKKLDTNKLEDGATLCRLYLISKQQFREVVEQENAIDSLDHDRFEEAIKHSHASEHGTILLDSLYGRLMHLGTTSSGDETGRSYPIYTFTCQERHPLGAPSANYLKTICRGICQLQGDKFDLEQTVAYFKSKAGANSLDHAVLRQWIQDRHKM